MSEEQIADSSLAQESSTEVMEQIESNEVAPAVAEAENKGSGSFRPELHEKLAAYIASKNGEAFLMAEMKKALFNRTDYGGRKFRLKLVSVFNLEEWKEKGNVMLKAK